MQRDWQTTVSLEERKKKLLAEGALLRIEVIDARSQVRASLYPGALAKGAVNRMVEVVSSIFSKVLSRHATWGSLSPLLIGGISLLSKPYLRKPMFYAGVIGSVAALACCLKNKKNQTAEAEKAEFLPDDA